MAQTRRASPSQKKQANGKATIKKTSQLPTPPSSALRAKVPLSLRGRHIQFDEARDHDPTGPHPPPTPYPVSQHEDHSPQSDRLAQQTIDHGKRKEREALLERAAKTMKKIAPDAEVLPMAPESIRNKKSVSFAEPVRGSDEVRKPVKLSSGPIDTIQDDIPGSREDVDLPEAIENVVTSPSDNIRLEDICSAFDTLKRQIQYHCRDLYAYKMAPRDPPAPFFTTLKVRHGALFRYIQYVADGGQYGWDKLLTVANQRENLVYGIISRALVAYVFDAELFGASEEHEEELLEMCREYLDFDAFVRNKHRAEIIARVLSTDLTRDHNTKGKGKGQAEEGMDYFKPAINTLAHRLHLLLGPLLELSGKPSKQRPRPPTPSEHVSGLSTLIETAHKIHVAIRLHGQCGSVFRFEHITKHREWDSTTMRCVNKGKMDLTAHHGPRPLVKVSCFPAIFAYVPSGPTLESFEDERFVREWQKQADDQGSKPIITTYPITLGAVVLENSPPPSSSSPAAHRSATLSQAMAAEQSLLSDRHMHRLTGIDRARNRRAAKTAARIKKFVRHTATAAAAGLGVAGVAVAGLWLFRSHHHHHHHHHHHLLLLLQRHLENLHLPYQVHHRLLRLLHLHHHHHDLSSIEPTETM